MNKNGEKSGTVESEKEKKNNSIGVSFLQKIV
jgi:hypothetical protein